MIAEWTRSALLATGLSACTAAREFLGEQGIEFESLDIRGDGAPRWAEAGRPIVPRRRRRDDHADSPRLAARRRARAAGTVLGGADPRRVGDAAAAALLARPPSAARPRTADGADAVRSRSLRNLTVNVFHPIELLRAAWSTLDFPWEPERDDERERGLATAAEVVGYAERRLADWTDFVLEHATTW